MSISASTYLSDFAKLRINFKGNRVSITVMSPYVIPAANLQTPDSIFTGELEMIWQTIWRSAHMSQTDNAEINYQREKSLVVMANYLLSYNNTSKLFLSPIFTGMIRIYCFLKNALCAI